MIFALVCKHRLETEKTNVKEFKGKLYAKIKI